jgi:hypothetical protein
VSVTRSVKAVIATFLLPIALQVTLASQTHAAASRPEPTTVAEASAPVTLYTTTGWQ